jgi:hypothetical protein
MKEGAGCSSGICRDNHPVPDECRRCSGRIGLACVSGGGPPCSEAGWLRVDRRAASAGGGLPKGRGDRIRSQWAAFLVGESLLSCALQMLSCSKRSSDWLAGAMWSWSSSAVASGARSSGRWGWHRPRWLASACFPLPVDQKLVVGLEMRYGRLSQSVGISDLINRNKLKFWLSTIRQHKLQKL